MQPENALIFEHNKSIVQISLKPLVRALSLARVSLLFEYLLHLRALIFRKSAAGIRLLHRNFKASPAVSAPQSSLRNAVC